MIDQRDGELLHDRSTRGENFSSDDERRLAAWYASLDAFEAVELRLGEPSADQTATNGFLKDQIDVALSTLIEVAQQNRKIAAKNDSLRREITLLQRQLASLPPQAP